VPTGSRAFGGRGRAIATWRRRISTGGTVGEINDASIINALRKQMTIATARELASASNLANVNTPGYKTRDVAFEDALNRQMDAAEPVTTDPKHLGAATSGAGVGTAVVDNLPERRDGNNVQIDRELISMSRAGSDFAAAQTVLAAKFRLVRYAINEGH
jgi:flagellar basal-body rod protein FlgB